MDVLHTIVRNTALDGMPVWYKAISLSIFSTIVIMLSIMMTLLLMNGPEMTIRFGY